jgi:putative membrane protein
VPAWLRHVTSPLAALLILSATVVVTHLPGVVDALMASQVGSFAIDMAWFAAGIIFWWPVISPVPFRARFTQPVMIGYLILGIMFSPVTIALVSVLVFNQQPLYATYELAPRVSSLSALADHQVAGLLMSVGGSAITLLAITVLFFQWVKSFEGRAQA